MRCRGQRGRPSASSPAATSRRSRSRGCCTTTWTCFLLDEPTRGIDVGSKAEIYALIDELALRGQGRPDRVSSYLPELLGVCDRVAVMHRGRLGAARPVAELTEHSVLMEAIGQA